MSATTLAPRCRVCRRVADLRADGLVGPHSRPPVGGSNLIQHALPCEGEGRARLAAWELRPEQAFHDLAGHVAAGADRARLLGILRLYEFGGEE